MKVIYSFEGLEEDEEVSRIKWLYLPPYSPFFNPIVNILTVWKNSVVKAGATTEKELRNLLQGKLGEITEEQCYSSYEEMSSNLLKCSNEDIIIE